MKNKVLNLCKRLNKVTVSEIAPILMLDEKEVSNILNELVSEDKLTVREDLIYFYKEVERKAPLPLFFEYREKEEIEFVYALENNITLLAGGERDRYYTGEGKRISENLSEMGEWSGKVFGMTDEAYMKINILIEAEEETTYLYMPNYTISDAVVKLEMNYQNSTIVCLKKMNLKPNEKKSYKIKVNAKDI